MRTSGAVIRKENEETFSYCLFLAHFVRCYFLVTILSFISQRAGRAPLVMSRHQLSNEEQDSDEDSGSELLPHEVGRLFLSPSFVSV